jgi:hypothetical protein
MTTVCQTFQGLKGRGRVEGFGGKDGLGVDESSSREQNQGQSRTKGCQMSHQLIQVFHVQERHVRLKKTSNKRHSLNGSRMNDNAGISSVFDMMLVFPPVLSFLFLFPDQSDLGCVQRNLLGLIPASICCSNPVR